MTALSQADRTVVGDWDEEVRIGERFGFGANWASFLSRLDDSRIERAENSLKDMLGSDRLDGQRFLDAGSGSGLFSLAARNLGADIVSFDFDPQSVSCTAELRRRYCDDDAAWRVERGSVLDSEFLGTLGSFDIVYSWGVLHHTGAMWQALANVGGLVRPGGLLFISIYNDQGAASQRWTKVKRAYVRAPRLGKAAILAFSLIPLWGPAAFRKLVSGKLKSLSPSTQTVPRGMDPWHDAKDWVGGYPFEVAKPEQIFQFYRDRGFELRRMKTCGGSLGCNEYVFEKAG